MCFYVQVEGVFQRSSATFRITSVAGHVFSTDFPRQYQSWESTDPATLFEAPVIKAEANPKAHVPAHLAGEATGCDYMVVQRADG